MGIFNYCVTKYPKLGDLEQQQFILSEFTRLEVQIGGVGKIGSFRKAQRKSLFCDSPSFWRSLAILSGQVPRQIL